MTYEEKRELRLQISQLLADAGLNQKVIKDMVLTEIKNKVDRAVDQALVSLNAQTEGNDHITKQINKWLNDRYLNQYVFKEVVAKELKDRIIQVNLKNVELDKDL